MHSVMRIGTRKSALALAQTHLFIESCKAAAPDADIRYEIVEMSTAGDRILDRPLYAFAGKGMFVSVFEKALSEGRIDAAIHSGKDMPIEIPENLTVAAVLPRANPRDVLVTLQGRSLTEGSVIGTGSLRRKEQVRTQLGYGTRDIRGNVNTRLQKLREGQVDGLILAAAGLERLSFLPDKRKADVTLQPEGIACGVRSVCQADGFVFTELHEKDFLPAAAQGIIAVESRKDSRFGELFAKINDTDTMYCFLAERAYLAGIGAGCQQPAAAYSRCADGRICMDAAYWQEGRLCRFSGEEQAGNGAKLAAELAEKVMAAGKRKKGHVYLVGAGPGSRELITVKGLKLLQECDTVIYDRLSGEELLSETKPCCERIYVGKRAGQHSMKQEEITRLLIQKAEEGKSVVRLKGGDPFVFGRGGEEAEGLMAANIPFSLVPGVTSAVAVPELAGIPVTHREMSRSFHVITGHTAEKEPEKHRAYLKKQIEGLKDAEGTFVFLMGLSSIDTICRLLLECGKAPGLPVAVIGSGTRYDETVVRGTLADIAGRVKAEQVVSPAVIVAGETAALSLRMDAVSPLQGVRIGVTGTKELADKLGGMLREAGAEVLYMQELFPRSLQGLDTYFAHLSDYTWIVFTSANGVRLFFKQLAARNMDIRSLGGIRFAVVGSGTAEALQAQGILPDFMPDIYTAERLAAGLANRLAGAQDRVLLYQAEKGNPVLEETLKKAGLLVERAAAYTVEAGALQHREALATLSYLTFASSSGVRAFYKENPRIFTEEAMGDVCAAAIGTQTAEALQAAGCRKMLTAQLFTAEGLVAAIIADRNNRNS